MRRMVFVIALLSGAAGIAVATIVVMQLNRPAIGIVYSRLQTRNVTTAPPVPTGTYQGHYISFSYPGIYKPMPLGSGPGYVEVVGYSSPTTSRHLNVSVVRERLENDSGFHYRQQHPELYARDTTVQSGAVFYRLSGGGERTAYAENDGMVAAISISSSVHADLEPDLQTVLASLVWHSVY